MSYHNRFHNGNFGVESVLMNMMRGTAVIGVVIHHWLLFLPYKNSEVVDFVKTFSGDFVHLFFIISGWGLTISYFTKGMVSWKAWALRRFSKIILPFWIIISSTFICVNLTHSVMPAFSADRYSWLTLFTYLTFTRDFYSPGWSLNGTFWFMPVIVGLYILFPLLAKILREYGPFVLLSISAPITYFSIAFFTYFGYPTTYQAALPLFYLIEFSCGMLAGYTLLYHPAIFRSFSGSRSFFFGLVLYGCSWIMIETMTHGWFLSDLLTCAGIFLIMLTLCHWMAQVSSEKSIKFLSQVSKRSYLIYLIHGPVIMLIMRPLFKTFKGSEMHPFIMIILGAAFCYTLFILAGFLLSPINSFIFHLYKTPRLEMAK